MQSITFIDQEQQEHQLQPDSIDDIFGFHSRDHEDAMKWYYWVCLRDGKVLKSRLFDTLEAAREEYGEIKLTVDGLMH